MCWPGKMTNAVLLVCLGLASAALLCAQAPGRASAVDVARGKKVFAARCAICHYAGSRAKKIGPGLQDLSRRGRYADGQPVDDASLRQWIEKGGKDMPGFKSSLDANQVRDLLAYLKTL